MKLSVLIPTYNRLEILQKTLKTLEAQTLPHRDFEVVIINDGSTDDTRDWLDSYNGKLNIVALHQKNAGQGIARNNGIKKTQGDIILFLGDDMLPAHPDFLELHVKSHEKHYGLEWAALGRIDWPPYLEQNDFMKWMTNGSSIFGKFGGHQFAYEKLDRGQKPDYNFFYTSNLSLKRKFLGDTPFDDDFSKYGWEDIELGYRLQKKQGMKMMYLKEALTYHDHPMDASGLKNRMIAIGRSAHIIDAKYPELNKLPGTFKKIAFYLLSNPLSLIMIWLINELSRKRLQALYYYAVSKKYFLKGVNQGIIYKRES
jgi:glycosyltransferase involved in cell wall biosynthesis